MKRKKKNSRLLIILVAVSATILILSTAFIGFKMGWFIKTKIKQTPAINSISQQTGADTKTATAQTPKTKEYYVPILMYHYIRNAENEDELGQNLSVSPANFKAQVKWLKENGYETIKMEDLADPEKKTIAELENRGKKPVILTFDDGYRDAYTNAFPILKENNFTGTFYIIRNRVGDNRYLTKTQIEAMDEAGMEIGSHSTSHPNLASLSNEKASREIIESKEESKTFCYPSGRYNAETMEIVKNAGYLNAVTTKTGIANEKSDPFELPRIRVTNMDLESFAKKVNEK